MKWEDGEKESEGEEGRTTGRSHAGETLESLPRETNREGRCQLSCYKLREIIVSIQPPWSHWLVMNLVSIVQVL